MNELFDKIENIEIIEDDILNTKAHIICHQVNCCGVMNGGVAKSIKEKYPKCYTDYIDTYIKTEYKKDLLGSISITQLFDVFNKNTVNYIINIFGQHHYGKSTRYTNYDALYKGLEKVRNFAYELSYIKHQKIDIAIPYKIGCGLGGGNWNIVYIMICEIFKWVKEQINIKIYKHE